MATYREVRQARERAGRQNLRYRRPRPTRNQLASAVANVRPSLKTPLKIPYGSVGKLADPLRPFLPDVREIGGAVETMGNVVGGPRASIVSGMKETIDLGQDIIGLFRGRGWGGESSWDDFWEQSTNNYGFGDLVNDERATMGWGLLVASPFTGMFAPVVAGMGAAVLQDNIWADRVIGFVGDVALDPLTYMGGTNIMVRALGSKHAGLALSSLKRVGRADLGRMLQGTGLGRGVGVDDAVKAIDDAIDAASRGRSIGTIQRSLQRSPAGRAVARATGLEPGMRLRVPGTGAIGRKMSNTPLGRTAARVLDKMPGQQFTKDWMLDRRIANIPVAMRMGLDDASIRGAVQAAKTVRGDVAKQISRQVSGEVPVWRPVRRMTERVRLRDIETRKALRRAGVTDPRLREVAGRVARSHAEIAVPGMARWGATGAQLGEAISKLPLAGGRGRGAQQVLGGRLFARGDLPLTMWRNMPVPLGGGGLTGVAGKAAKMFKYMGDDTSEQLGNIFKPSEWDRVYAENPGLANEIQRGATRFYRNHLSIGDRVFRELLDSGDPDQIARAWSAEQSLRFARGQQAFFKEVSRRTSAELNRLAKQGSLPNDEGGERALGRWLRAALNGEVLIRDDQSGRIASINRSGRWWNNLPKEIQALNDKELIQYATTVTDGMDDSSKILRQAFGEPDGKGGWTWAEESEFLAQEGLGYFPRRIRDEMRELFGIKVVDEGTRDLQGDAFEGGFKTAQSMRTRSWRPGSYIKLTKEAAAAAKPGYVVRDAKGQAWLGRRVWSPKNNQWTVKRFRVEQPNKVGLSTQDQIDDAAVAAFGKPMFEGYTGALDSYAGGMAMQMAGESLMSHLKYTMGFDDMFRMHPSVAKNFQRVAREGLEEVDPWEAAMRQWLGTPVARTRAAWDKAAEKMQRALDKKLASIRERTRKLYVSSDADLELVMDANAKLAGIPVDPAETTVLQSVQGWRAANEAAVRLMGEMDGITYEMSYYGARLNQIFKQNEQAIADGTFKVPDEVKDIIVKMHDRAARAFQIQEEMAKTAADQRGFADGVVGANTGGVDLDGLEDMFQTMVRNVDQSMSYLSGTEGYIGQFPLAVQQSKLLGAYDKSVQDMLDLAEILDPQKAAEMFAAAEAAGSQAMFPAQTTVAPGQLKVYRGTTGGRGGVDRGAVDPEALPFGEGTYVTPDEALAGTFGADVAEYGLDVRPDQIFDMDAPIGSLHGETAKVMAVDLGLPLRSGSEATERFLRDRFVTVGEAYYAHNIGSGDPVRWTNELLSETGYKVIRQVGMVGEEMMVLDPKVLKATTVVGPVQYRTWRTAYKEAMEIDRTVGHQDFIQPGVSGTINVQQALDELADIDARIVQMVEIDQARRVGDPFDEALRRVRATKVGDEKVDIPEPFVSPQAEPSVAERIFPGRPFDENFDLTTDDILVAAQNANDEGRALFTRASEIRAQLDAVDAELAAFPKRTPDSVPVKRRLKQQQSVLRSMATTAEMSAQAKVREAAELLDMTRAQRELEKLEGFLPEGKTIEDVLNPDKPFEDRYETILGFVDMVSDGMANWGPWRIASGNEALDANMVSAAQAFQRLQNLRDPEALRGFLKRWDQLQNWFKAGVIATPGFVYRNMFGAFFNAYLDGVDLGQIILATKATTRINEKAQRDGTSFIEAARGLADSVDKPDEYMKDFVSMLETGVRGGGQATREANPFIGQTESGRVKRWLEQGFTIGDVEAGIARGGLKGPFRLAKTVLDVVTRRDRAVRSLGTLLPVGPGSSNWMWNRAIRTWNSQVEDVVRLGVGMDTLRWGGTVNDAIDRIARTQFDYSELTPMESQLMRRIIPFYVWTRKNVPYQFNKLATNPAAYNRVMAVKKNMELGTEDEGMVPDWFLEPFGIRTPWSWAGARVYTVPDLPFLDLFRYDPTRMAPGDPFFGLNETMDNMTWQLSPIIKTPLEMMFNSGRMGGFKFFGNYEPVPGVIRELPGLMPALKGLGIVAEKDGEPQIRDNHLYFVMNSIPALSVARRLVPTEQRYQERLWESIFSSMFGLGIQRQTPEVKERWRNRLENQLRREQSDTPQYGF